MIEMVILVTIKLKPRERVDDLHRIIEGCVIVDWSGTRREARPL
jgi:hypothetical protein